MNKDLIYDVEDSPKFSKLLIFALQQVLAIMAATIAVPTIIGLPIQIPSAILGAGLGTLTYLFFTKFKSPVCISSSFAFLTALSNAIAFGYFGIVLGAIFAGLVYVVIALILKKTGTGWLEKVLPAVIIGPTVAIIGLSLAGSAMGDIVKANGDALNSKYNLIALLCGLVTFFVVVFCSVQNKFKQAKLLPFIIGIGAGYALAAIFTAIGLATDVEYLKVIDWSPIVNNFKPVKPTSFFDYPKIALVEAIKELKTGNVSPEILAANENATTITWIGVAEVALSFIPVALVVLAEHIADHANLGTIIGRHLIHGEPGLHRTLMGDGVGSIVGTAFGICPNTTYGESIGCVAITKNASVKTIFTASIMCIVLSFFKPLMVVLQSIPSCVMGGVCLTLYGFIAVSGFKMFKDIDLSKNKNLFTASVILISGIGGLTIQIPISVFNDTVPGKGGHLAGQVSRSIQITSVATALILGIITYAICSKIEKKENESKEN